MIQLMLAFIFWYRLVSGAGNVDWGLNQKLKTIENSIIFNNNLAKYINILHYDNNAFKDDETKIKRVYENARCIKELQWIQGNINDAKNGWPYECMKHYLITC